MASTREDLILGEIAIKARVITRQQLEKVLQEQKKLTHWKSLGEFLLEKKYVTPTQLQLLVDVQRRNLELKTYQARRIKQDNLFGRLIIRRGFASERQVEEALGEQLIADDANFLRLGEIMVKKGFISEEQFEEVVGFQTSRQISCAKCGQKYNMILFNDGAQIQCFNCENTISVIS